VPSAKTVVGIPSAPRTPAAPAPFKTWRRLSTRSFMASLPH